MQNRSGFQKYFPMTNFFLLQINSGKTELELKSFREPQSESNGNQWNYLI